jgi:hypothetical protein
LIEFKCKLRLQAPIYSLEEVRSQKSGYTLESNFEDTKNLKIPFKRIEEHDETSDKENDQNTSSQQLDVEDNLADSSSTSLDTSSSNLFLNSSYFQDFITLLVLF